MPDGTYPLLAQYVVTDDPLAPSPLVRQVDRDPVGFVATLKRQLGKGIWLCGGGDLATQLLDEIWVKFTPPVTLLVVLGGPGPGQLLWARLSCACP